MWQIPFGKPVLATLAVATLGLSIGSCAIGAPSIAATSPERLAWASGIGLPSDPRVLRLTQVIDRYRVFLTADERHAVAQAIVDEAEKAGYDPFLIAGLAETESGFNLKAVSPRGARGLLQVLPSVAAYLAPALGVTDTTSAALEDPVLNLRLGLHLLGKLQRHYRGNLELALVAYNQGPGNLDRALAAGTAYYRSFAVAVRSHERSIRARAALVEVPAEVAWLDVPLAQN
jgi:soluble lytic murein transglycosylase-like protein